MASLAKSQLHDYACDPLHEPGLVIPVADTVPRYDVRSTCRAAVTLAAGSEGRTVESCMAGEEVARKFAYATLTLV